MEKLYRARPGLPTAMARAKAGQRIDELLDEIAELQRMIDASPAVTLEDAAVKLRRLEAYVDRGQPARLLAGALGAVERAVRWIPGRDRAQRVPEAAGGGFCKGRPDYLSGRRHSLSERSTSDLFKGQVVCIPTFYFG